MKFNFVKEKKEEITMESFNETMTAVEKDLDMYYTHLDECITAYIEGNIDFAEDKTVNHLTFYAFTYEYLDYIYGILKISYRVIKAGKEICHNAIEKFESSTGYMEYAYRYINIATIKYNALDDICKLFVDTFNEADEYLKNGCKCGMKFQKEKLPEKLPLLVIEALKKYEN